MSGLAPWNFVSGEAAVWVSSRAGSQGCPGSVGTGIPRPLPGSPELADVGHRQHCLARLVGSGQIHPRGQAPVVIAGRVIEDLAHVPAAGKLLDDQQSRAPRVRAGADLVMLGEVRLERVLPVL